MTIHGLNKTTLLDYPGRVAATVFTGGCNFRCPFCHNASLVLDPNSQPSIPMQEVLSFLNKRKHILSGVCITGGEPTLEPDLSGFLTQVKGFGLSVKLDTNGYRPDVIADLLKQGLLDYIAMDIKSCLSRYPRVCGVASPDVNKIRESVTLIMSSGIDYEFRTTIVPTLHSMEDLVTLASEIKGCKAYYLQPFQDSGDILGGHFGTYSPSELSAILAEIQKIIPNTQLRGHI